MRDPARFAPLAVETKKPTVLRIAGQWVVVFP
jgi:hypothetical protein